MNAHESQQAAVLAELERLQDRECRNSEPAADEPRSADQVDALIRANLYGVLRVMVGVFHKAVYEPRARPKSVRIDSTLPRAERPWAALEQFIDQMRNKSISKAEKDQRFGRMEEARKERAKILALDRALEAMAGCRGEGPAPERGGGA